MIALGVWATLADGRDALRTGVSRNSTKARTMNTLISVARGELRIVAAMMAPCSVNT